MSLSYTLGIVSPWQIIVVVALVLLLFGGKKIPELMRGLGSGIKEFKDATKEEEDKGGTELNS
jgi:sec-independent protein translocase protein TatA